VKPRKTNPNSRSPQSFSSIPNDFTKLNELTVVSSMELNPIGAIVMRGWLRNTVVFLIIWYVVASEFQLDAGASLIAAGLGIAGAWLAIKVGTQLLLQIGLHWWSFAALIVIWIVLFLKFVPDSVTSRGTAIAVAAAVLLATGAACRLLYRPVWRVRPWFRYVLMGLVLLVLTVIPAFNLVDAQRLSDSAWILAEITFLVAFPVTFGWRLASLSRRRLADARIGDPDDLRQAGLSEER
jgi:hypothetical protein